MKKLSFREKIGYGVGAVGLDLSYGLFYSYLSLYLTNVLHIKPWFLLIVASVARLWDGINDPAMGRIVDRTRTKIGRYRPWIISGAILNAVVLGFLFNNPGISLDSILLYAYVAVLYVAWGTTNSFADIPYWSMIPSFASEEKDRNLISTIARAFSGIGQGIITILTPLAVAYFGGSTESDLDTMGADTLRIGFGKWSIIAAVALVGFAAICVLSTKEKTVYKSEDSEGSFKDALKIIKKNDQLFIFMLFAILSNAGFYMTSGISPYYFENVLGDLTLQSKFNLMGTVGSVLSLLVIPVCSKFMTNRSTYKLSLGLAAGGYIAMALIGYTSGNVYALGACFMLTSLGTGSMFVNQTVMLSDVVDYGEFKLGTRNQSLTFSMKGLLQKVAYTVQSIIMYSAFSLTGFKGELLEQPESAKSAISFLMFIVPPAMMILSFIVFSKKYKIYGEFKQKVLAAVADKK